MTPLKTRISVILFIWILRMRFTSVPDNELLFKLWCVGITGPLGFGLRTI